LNRFAIPALALLALAAPASADIIYITNSSYFISYDTATSAEGVTFLSNNITGLAIQPGTNTLYTISTFPLSQGLLVSPVPQLSTVDPVTGVVTPIGGNLTGFEYLAFDQLGNLVGAESQSVAYINPLTGSHETPVFVSDHSIESFAVGPDPGTVLIVDSSDPNDLELFSSLNGGFLDNSGTLPCAGPPAPTAIFYSVAESQLFCSTPNIYAYVSISASPLSISSTYVDSHGVLHVGGIDFGATGPPIPLYLSTPDSASLAVLETPTPEPGGWPLVASGLLLGLCCFAAPASPNRAERLI
jgi:hypothetical protein